MPIAKLVNFTNWNTTMNTQPTEIPKICEKPLSNLDITRMKLTLPLHFIYTFHYPKRVCCLKRASCLMCVKRCTSLPDRKTPYTCVRRERTWTHETQPTQMAAHSAARRTVLDTARSGAGKWLQRASTICFPLSHDEGMPQRGGNRESGWTQRNRLDRERTEAGGRLTKFL